MAEVDAGLYEMNHLTHNVQRGNMDVWSNFYERIGNFREIRYFDIEGKLTGLHSGAMTAPCGKIRIPINESSDDKSQIEEYLRQYKGEGIQHIALASSDIYQTIRTLRGRGTGFMPTRTPTTRRSTAGSRAIRKIWPPSRICKSSSMVLHQGRHTAANLHRHRHRPGVLRDYSAQGQ